MRNRIALCVLALSFIFSCHIAEAATYYVNKAGDDANSCATATSATDADAKLTIEEGIECLSAGDTLTVGDGTYTEDLSTTSWTTGSSGSPIVIQAENQYLAIIKYTGTPGDPGMLTIPTNMSYITIKDFKFDGSALNDISSLLQIGDNGGGSGTHHITVTGNEFDGGNVNNSCINMGRDVTNNPANHTITNNYIHDCGSGADNQSHGIYFHGDDHVISGNTLKNIGGASPTTVGGFCIHGSTTTTNLYDQTDNLIHTNTCETVSNGIVIQHGTGNLIYNNWLFDVKRNAFTLSTYSSNAGMKIENNGIYNNTALTTGNYCFRHRESHSGQATGNVFKNNICWDNTLGVTSDSSTDGFTQSANVCNVGCDFTGDPEFVSEVTPDFNLTSGSSAISNGEDLSSLFTIDFNGDTRDTPWDIGAYGFDLDGPPVADGTLVLTTNTLSYTMADEGSITAYQIRMGCSSATTYDRFFTVPLVDALFKKDGTGTYNDLTNRQIKIKQSGVECDPYYVRIRPIVSGVPGTYSTEVEWSLP